MYSKIKILGHPIHPIIVAYPIALYTATLVAYIISAALGSAKSILLANHGLLTAGSSVEEATYLAVFFERAARMQLRAMAAGGYKEVKRELAEEARDFLLQPAIVRGTFAYWARRCG